MFVLIYVHFPPNSCQYINAIKLLTPNYLINTTVGCFFWPGGTMKKMAEAPSMPWTEDIWEPLS